MKVMNGISYDRSIAIYISTEDRDSIERASREYNITRDNFQFYLRLHMNDNIEELQNNEVYDRLLAKQIATSMIFEQIKTEITNKYVPSEYMNIPNLYWEVEYMNERINIYIPESYDGDIKASKIKNTIPRMEQFNECISRLYPELHRTENEKDKILTKSFTFQVTDACNLCCTYCYQINKGVRVMDFETAKKAVDLLLSGEKGFSDYLNPTTSPGIVLEFIGGEPFLQIDLIDQIVDYFREQALEMDHPWSEKFMISICSNGVLYNDERVQRFLIKNQNVLSFSITIDGNKELHDSCRIFSDGSGSYDIAVAAAQDWMNKGFYMGSKITIAPGNITYLYDAIMHMVDLGYTEINANCVYEEGWTLEHAKEYYKQLKKLADKFHEDNLYETIYCSLFVDSIGKPKDVNDLDNWCGGTGDMLSMDPDGYLYPCIRYMESSLGTDVPPIRIGHIDEGLGTTPEWSKCINCLKCIDRRTQSTDECFYCPIADGCSWCSGYNYQVFGTADKRVTYICDMHKARCLINVYYWNRYYRSINSDQRMELNCPKEWALEIIDEDEYNMLLDVSQK